MILTPIFYRILKRWLPLFLATLCLTAGAGRAAALDVTGLRVGTHPAKTRIVVELSNAAAFRSFLLADPARLVIDLPDYHWRAGAVLVNGMVRQVRQGALGNGVSRIVLALSGPAAIEHAFTIRHTGNTPDRIVIDLTKTSPENFSKTHAHVFGTLKDGPHPAQKESARQEPTPPLPPPAVPRMKPPLIVLDAGHGGIDPGAPGAHGEHEKNVTLAMARTLRDHLLATGRYRVLMTRDRDVFIRLSERVAIARRHKADLFISLHADSINKPGVHGASIYTLSEKASDKETEKLAARENKADAIAGINLDAQDDDVASILLDLAMRDTMNQSKFFANKIVRDFHTAGIDTLERAHRSAGFAVLKAPDIPSVLIELGYMSNSREVHMLSSKAYRDRIADALVGGIDSYFKTVRHMK